MTSSHHPTAHVFNFLGSNSLIRCIMYRELIGRRFMDRHSWPNPGPRLPSQTTSSFVGHSERETSGTSCTLVLIVELTYALKLRKTSRVIVGFTCNRRWQTNRLARSKREHVKASSIRALSFPSNERPRVFRATPVGPRSIGKTRTAWEQKFLKLTSVFILECR